MRVASGKGNDARKILTYYRVNFSLHAPYRVLCDGALIQHALSKRLYLRDALPALLAASAQAVVTRCVHEELRALGEPTSSAALFAKRLTRVPCAHADGVVPAADCLAAAVRGGNAGRYVIATNDVALLRSVRREPAVPVVRIVGEGQFVLAPPGAAAREKVGELEARKVGVQRPDEVRRMEEERLQLLRLREERRAARVAKRRKRPKGPNPLSVKKRKRAAVSSGRGGGGGSGSGGGSGGGSDDEANGDSGAAAAWTGGGASEGGAGVDAGLTQKPKRVRRRRPKPPRADDSGAGAREEAPHSGQSAAGLVAATAPIV
jgi:U3 small nucleolar RNA-associated protein 23